MFIPIYLVHKAHANTQKTMLKQCKKKSVSGARHNSLLTITDHEVLGNIHVLVLKLGKAKGDVLSDAQLSKLSNALVHLKVFTTCQLVLKLG